MIAIAKGKGYVKTLAVRLRSQALRLYGAPNRGATTVWKKNVIG
jgi:hypothetical protein